MFQSIPLHIGLRYARSGKAGHFIGFINTFSVAGVALGLAALITVLSVMNGFEAELKKRILGIVPHLLINQVSVEQQQVISGLPGVQRVEKFVESEGVIQSRLGLRGVLIQGVGSFDHSNIIVQNMRQGSLNYLQPGEYGIVLGQALARQLGLQMGDQARILSTQSSVYSPMGRVPSQRLFRVVGVFDIGSEMDDKVILMNIDDAARLTRKKAATLAKLRLTLKDAFAYKAVEQSIKDMGLDVTSWRVRQGPLFDAVKMEKNMMGLMLLLIIAVAAFNIVSGLVMLVSEKYGDIAILRTQGMNRNQLIGVFMINGLYNGIKGTLIGLLLGLLLVWKLNNLLAVLGVPLALGANGQGLPVDLQYAQVAWVALFSVLLCFVATFYPAWRASKVEPAQALKYE